MADRELRRPPKALRRRYLEERLWRDDTLGSLIADRTAANGDLAFRIHSASRPYEGNIASVHERARRLATGLRGLGVGPGDVVAFQLPNWVEAAVTFFGLAHLGAVLVPIVHFYGPKEVRYILAESDARLLVTADAFGRLDFLAGLESIRPDVPALEEIVVVGDRVPEGARPFDAVAAADPEGTPLACDPDAPAVIGYTSGTTAEPKGVVHTHRSLTAEVRQLAAIQAASDRAALVGAPVAHAIGMLAGLLLPLRRGQAIHLTDLWDPGAVLQAMVDDDLTAGSGATFFCQSLVDHPDFGEAHRKRMRYIGLGGAPVPSAFCDRLTALGISAARSYGSTEHPSTTGSAHDEHGGQRCHTDGRPLGGVEVRIVDAAGADVSTGDPGEVWSRGPDLFAGYTDPALDETAFADDGWYRTGDVGVLDEHGALTITDRLKDVIIRGGENVSATEVEGLVLRMPGVAEVALVAAPDPRLGEHGCAFLRPAAGAVPPSLDEIRAHLQAVGLARQKWPEDLRVVDDLPRTPTGKVRKHELRAHLRAGTS